MSTEYTDEYGEPTFPPIPDEEAFTRDIDFAGYEDLLGAYTDDDVIRAVYDQAMYSLHWVKAAEQLAEFAKETGLNITGQFSSKDSLRFHARQGAISLRVLEVLRAVRSWEPVPPGSDITVRPYAEPEPEPEEEEPDTDPNFFTI